MNFTIEIGRLPVAIEADRLPEPLRHLFDAFPRSERRPQLTFVFEYGVAGRRLPGDSFPVAGAEIHPDFLAFTDYAATLGFVATRQEEGGLRFYCDLNDRSRAQGWRKQLGRLRFFHRFYFNREWRSLGFLYALYQYALHSSLLEEGCSLVHASCVERSGRAVLFPAWGGVGKTSLVYQLVTDGGWRFLSDDMAILARDGSVFLNPAPLAVYPYNLEGMPEIYRKIMARESLLGRLQWHLRHRLRGPDRVGRRISPQDLFGAERVGSTGALDRVVYLVRSSGSRFRLQPVSAPELAARATSVLLAEIRQFRHELQAWNSVPGCSLFPFVWEIAEKTLAVLTAAFEDRELAVLTIPSSAPPPAVRRYLEDNFLAGDDGRG